MFLSVSNGTVVECVDGANLQPIGSTTICIVGKRPFMHVDSPQSRPLSEDTQRLGVVTSSKHG